MILFADQISVYGTFQSGTIAVSANSTSVEVLNDPTQIPEISASVIITFLVSFLTAAIVFKKIKLKRKGVFSNLRGKRGERLRLKLKRSRRLIKKV